MPLFDDIAEIEEILKIQKTVSIYDIDILFNYGSHARTSRILGLLL